MKVGSHGFLLLSAALRLTEGDCNLDLKGSGNPLFLLSQVAVLRKGIEAGATPPG